MQELDFRGVTTVDAPGELPHLRLARDVRARLGGRPWRRVVAVGFIAVLLGLTGALLALGQANSHRQLEDRFALRLGLGASFARSYIDDISARAARAGTTELAGAAVSADEFSRVGRALGFEAAVLLDSSGTLLQVIPEQPALLGTDLAARYQHLRQAVDGRVAVSNVVNSAAASVPIVAFATPYDTPFGRRVISGGYLLSNTPLGVYLGAALPFASGAAYLIDGEGVVVATNVSAAAATGHLADHDQGLEGAMSTNQSGTYSDSTGTHFFSVKAIPETTLRMVGKVSLADLYAPLSGPISWLPWLVLASLAAGSVYLLRLLLRLARADTRLRLAAVELERSNRELRDFASVASHDLQEPLRKIQAFGDRLATSAADVMNEESADYLARMRHAAARMQTLIQELLAYSRVASTPVANVEVDLGVIVGEVLADLEERIGSSGGTVDVGPLPTVEADPMQMRQLFQNLIANALKFHREDVPPVIQIRAQPVGTARLVKPREHRRAWEVSVADNGIGFDEKYLDRIFIPFQRLHGRQAFEGTGMGLAIVRRIVEGNGGSVTATSTLDVGTTFVVTLPAL